MIICCRRRRRCRNIGILIYIWLDFGFYCQQLLDLIQLNSFTVRSDPVGILCVFSDDFRFVCHHMIREHHSIPFDSILNSIETEEKTINQWKNSIRDRLMQRMFDSKPNQNQTQNKTHVCIVRFKKMIMYTHAISWHSSSLVDRFLCWPSRTIQNPRYAHLLHMPIESSLCQTNCRVCSARWPSALAAEQNK